MIMTGQRGEFTMANLPPGIYDVSIIKDGFRTLHETGLELQLDQQARMDYHLQLGSLAEKVEVTASVPLVNTENAMKGDVMVGQEMIEMPLNGRDFSDLLFLMPNVVQRQGGTAPESDFATNGQRGDNVNFVIDGINNRNPRGGTPAVQPNLDAMQEFKVETSGYSAEAGRNAGGLVPMVLKSGTNQFHGGLFEFLRNDKMDARNFFSTSKPELRRNQFGGLLSGPVWIPKLYNGHNRTFFLFSWESCREVDGSPTLAVVPTASMEQGDFSALGPIKDPLATGSFFPGNRIPLSRMSPTSLKIQTVYPLPNNPGLNNFYSAVPGTTNWDSPLIKIDQVLTSRDNLSFTYLKRYNNNVAPYNDGKLPMLDGEIQHGRNTLVGLNYTHIFTPALIDEARFGVTRSVQYDVDGMGAVDYNSQFGLPGPADPKLMGFPKISVTNFTALGTNAAMPLQYWITSYNASNTLTWTKGTHLIKFGGEVLLSDFFRVYDTNVRGTYTFTGSWTSQPFADFLLGLPNSDSMLIGEEKSYLISPNYSAFVQDAWKVTRRLTLDLGLRYELPKPLYDKYGRLENFVPELGKLVVGSMAGAPAGVGFTNASAVETAAQAGLPSSLQYTSYKKFAPRFGFAWRPYGGNHTVLRGGYGLFYGTWEFNSVLNAFAGTFPFVINITNNRNANNPSYLTFANAFPVAPNLVQSVLSVSGYQLQAPNPYTQSWNLTLEREIGHASALEMGYIGSKGTHLSYTGNVNQPIRSAATYPNFPVPYPQWSTISYVDFSLNSIYNAASFTFRRRFADKFFYRASYTYSKSIDQGSHLTYSGEQDPRNMRLERGRSDWDRGHVFTMDFSWQAPKRYNVFLRGWQLAGTGIASTGFPVSPSVNNVNLNLGEAGRPNRIAKGTLPHPSVQHWYDTSAFPAVATGSYTFGTSGRDILDGPGKIALNLALSRNFPLREKSNLQFRLEAFNFLNRANFGQPVETVNTPNAATIVSAADGRNVQVALRYSF